MHYIGETRNSLRTRLSHHKYNIVHNHKADTHLVQHFQKHGFGNLYMRPLQHQQDWTTHQRKEAEQYWITKLNTKHPNGLNEKDSL